MPSHDTSLFDCDDDDDVTIVDNTTTRGPSQEVLSTQLLQSTATDWEAEREQCRQNGNVSPRGDKQGGKNLDQTCLRLAIERPATTAGGKSTTHYWCIACDKFCANNSRNCAFEHAEQCKVGIYSKISMRYQQYLTCLSDIETGLAQFS